MSLFNTIAAESEQMAEQETSIDTSGSSEESLSTGSAEPLWWVDANTPGSGERPSWLNQKFKTAEDVAKAYHALEKKFMSGPEEYDLSKGESWLDMEYEPLHNMIEMAKSKRVPQEVMDTMLDSVGKYLDEFKVDYNEEKSKLGDKAEERLNILSNWAKSNFSEKTFDALTQNMRTADAVLAIEEMRMKMMDNRTTIPTGNEDTSSPRLTLEAIQQEMTTNFARYKTDPIYRKEISQKIEQASQNSGFVDKSY